MAAPAQLAHERSAIKARHNDVGNDQVDLTTVDRVECLQTVFGVPNQVALVQQCAAMTSRMAGSSSTTSTVAVGCVSRPSCG